MTGAMEARGHGLRRGIAVGLFVLVSAGACGSHRGMEVPRAQQLSAEVREILGSNRRSAEYHRERNRLQEMGPDLDVILVGLIGDSRARVEVRADALVLLADRQSPLALPTLQSLLQSRDERLRAAAVLGLSRLVPTTPEAIEPIRKATSDRSRIVRLNALQSLSIRDIATVRHVAQHETDIDVLQVAQQLIAIAEGRGAPLSADFRGTLRTVGGQFDPQIVFRPVVVDSSTGVARGDLRIELPASPDLPLAGGAIVVDNVVPAFFSPDRSRVVVEADGEIRVVDINTREVRTVGPGLAPRAIPFTQEFVFVRERSSTPDPRTDRRVATYTVYRGNFLTPGVENIGELTARVHPQTKSGLSPVRWMVVDEVGDGFSLRGDDIETFPLPSPVWSPLPPNEGGARVGGIR